MTVSEGQKRSAAPAASRQAGLLCHITSLPGPGPVGDLGAAHAFAEFLSAAGVRLWQVLPLVPTDPATGNSPYSSNSAFALNPLLLDVGALAAEGLVAESALADQPPGGGPVDYRAAGAYKQSILKSAFESFARQGATHPLFQQWLEFRRQAAWWLEDFCLFVALKAEQGQRRWLDWPPQLAAREAAALERARARLAREIEFQAFIQFILARQFSRLKEHLAELGIVLLGDLPIYVDHDSADVWANREVFKLDENGRPHVVAGVPPDYFSSDGQLWGNPVYDWPSCRQRNYAWWRARLRRALELFDWVRLDHFRGFVAYWEVPAGSRTARRGQWARGPGREFFERLRAEFGHLPLVAEDLGDIDEPVRRLMAELELPGCRVLQFGFSDDLPDNPHRPENLVENCVVYTGTHDNDTCLGWYLNEAGAAGRRRLERALGRSTSELQVAWDMCRLALESRARLAVLPLQDVLGLDSRARMNVPGRGRDNWRWRAPQQALDAEVAGKLRQACLQTGRLVN